MILNLTPHEVTILGKDSAVKKVFPSVGIARLELEIEPIGDLEDVPITETKPVKVIGLPEYKTGVFYIVSQWVKNSPLCLKRKDLLVPTEIVRDSEGKVLGCKALGC